MKLHLIFSNGSSINAIGGMKGGKVQVHFTANGRHSKCAAIDCEGASTTTADIARMVGVSGKAPEDAWQLRKAANEVNRLRNMMRPHTLEIENLELFGIIVDGISVVEVSGRCVLHGRERRCTLPPVVVDSFEKLCRETAENFGLANIMYTAKSDILDPEVITVVLSEDTIARLKRALDEFQNPTPTVIEVTGVEVGPSRYTPDGSKRGDVEIRFTHKDKDGTERYYKQAVYYGFHSFEELKAKLKKAAKSEHVVFEERSEKFLKETYELLGLGG